MNYVKLLKQDSAFKYNNRLPIIGRREYLQGKSNEFGWFVSNDYIMAFFLDRRFIFSRIVFTIAPYLYSESIEADESVFLNDVVNYIKKYKMCDFIYKAQSNVVFKACPKDVDCVPWGTYQVSLKKTEDELFASFHQKSRNVIRNAIKSGVIVKKCNNAKVVYENIKSTLERQNSVHYPSLEYLEKLYKLKENAVFLVSKKDDVIQGTLVLLYDKCGGYAMYAGSIIKPQTGSLDLLHFEAMKFLQKKNIYFYDFVGTRIHIKQGSKQEGIDRFKRKFKPKLIKGYAFKVIIKPFKYLLFSIFSGIYFKLKGISYIDPIEEIQKEEALNSILLIGPRYNKKDATKVSGTIVLFENLLQYCNDNKLSYYVIDSNKANYKYYYLAYFTILLQFLKKVKYSKHISLHSSSDYMVFSPILLLYANIFAKKVSLRKFGGNLKDIYLNASFFKKKYLEFLLSHMNYLFFETKDLVSFFSAINKNTYWFPNVRSRTFQSNLPRKYTKKFVFISHVLQAKGIDEILEVAKKLDSSYTIDIYGPFVDKSYTENDFKGYSTLSYRGVLASDQVLEYLNKYNVVLLPSYKEGYPGIVIEAYSLGIPVITTSLDSIKEIVDDYETGILISPKNTDELEAAMGYFNEDNYEKMSVKAYQKFTEFDSQKITKYYCDIIYK